VKHFCLRTTPQRLCRASVLLALCASWAYALSQAQKAAELPAPGQIADVSCASDAAQTYALYLPSAYTPAKRWPIIYFFDPGGRGRRPLELYKDIAEPYGFILAASNNSRNFSSDQGKAVNAVWQDTHSRLAIDEHRSYASGFSGGARVAGAMALSGAHGQIAGVIAHGAGYPGNKTAAKDDLPYFFAVGDQDFNWPEVVNIRREREEQGEPYRVRVYSGRHQWAPAAVMEEAMQYMNLKAIQAGNLAADEAFIDRLLEKTRAEAADAESRKDSIAQLTVYRASISDFGGLRDVKEAAQKLTALQQAPALKAALKSEREEMSEQLKLEQEISQKIASIADNSAADIAALRIDVMQRMGALNDQGKHSKNEQKRLISGRAFNGILVGTMEDGQQQLAARHFEKAEAYFDLMRQISDDPWPALLLADTHASAGNRKLAIRDLQEAVRRGLKDRAVIESDPQLQSLRNEPDFQKLLAGMEGK
jgi:dienelactone hydrolase